MAFSYMYHSLFLIFIVWWPCLQVCVEFSCVYMVYIVVYILLCRLIYIQLYIDIRFCFHKCAMIFWSCLGVDVLGHSILSILRVGIFVGAESCASFSFFNITRRKYSTNKIHSLWYILQILLKILADFIQGKMYYIYKVHIRSCFTMLTRE